MLDLIYFKFGLGLVLAGTWKDKYFRSWYLVCVRTTDLSLFTGSFNLTSLSCKKFLINFPNLEVHNSHVN